jgi:acyl carrier protein
MTEEQTPQHRQTSAGAAARGDGDALRATVRHAIRELAPNPVEEVSPSDRLEEDLLFDSLALTELALRLEQDLELPGFDEELVDIELETVGDVEDVVANLVRQTASAP